jgi:cysteine synthase B
MEARARPGRQMVAAGKGIMLDQFSNRIIRRRTTRPPPRRSGATKAGKITHFVSSMGTTGTIMGCARYFKEMNPAIQIVGVQPEEGAQIPGIRKWPLEYLPSICDFERIDRMIYVGQADAEETTRRLAREEGIFAGISSGGAMWAALQLAREVEDAVIVSIICDRGDRYLSTGIFPA